MAPVSSILHCLGIRFCRYLDDWLIQSHSWEEVLRSLGMVLSFCRELGIAVNPEKSKFVPSQRVLYLRTILDFVLFRASPYQQRVEKLLSIRKKFLSSRLQPSSTWQVLQGTLSSLSHHVLGGRLRMRSLLGREVISGLWSLEESAFPINARELFAVERGLFHFSPSSTTPQSPSSRTIPHL